MSKAGSPKAETTSEEYPHTESREKKIDLNMVLKPEDQLRPQAGAFLGGFSKEEAPLGDSCSLHATRWVHRAFETESEVPWS